MRINSHKFNFSFTERKKIAIFSFSKYSIIVFFLIFIFINTVLLNTRIRKIRIMTIKVTTLFFDYSNIDRTFFAGQFLNNMK